jgi:hypothetical protein
MRERDSLMVEAHLIEPDVGASNVRKAAVNNEPRQAPIQSVGNAAEGEPL